MTREEFEKEAARCVDALYGYALRLARDREDSADLVQETYVRAFAHMESFSSIQAVRPALYRILHNVFVDGWRRRKRRPDLVPLDETGKPPWGVEEPSSSINALSADLVRESLGEEVNGALNTLSEDSKETLWLREVEDFSYEEISAITSAPIGTVRSRLSRARGQLYQKLEGFARDRGFLERREFRNKGGSA